MSTTFDICVVILQYSFIMMHNTIYLIQSPNLCRCRIVNLPNSKPSPGMFTIPPRNICYILNFPPDKMNTNIYMPEAVDECIMVYNN
jgi:hypothetical protein